MHLSRRAAWTRRALLTQAGGLAAGAFVPPLSAAWNEPSDAAVAEAPAASASLHQPQAPAAPLIDGVAAVCQRLAPEGWRDLLLRVSGDALDITAVDLAAMLAQPLSRIDRTVPGFEDFALEGTRGIEPGMPAQSLLYHALASPNVFQDGAGHDLGAFPTPAELEAVENYVYGVQPPSLDELRATAGEDPLAVVVFALEYRTARETVHGKHADCCFARTGHARLGTAEPAYDARRREFLPVLADDPFAFPVQPVRYAPFLAVQRRGDPDSFGPMRATEDDQSRRFWVPLHKLFSGPECLQGLDLTVSLSTGHINQKLRRFHDRMANAGFSTGWSAPEIDQFPFVIEGGTIAAFSADPDYGSGWVMPAPHPFAEPAVYDGKPLTFFFSESLAAAGTYITSLQLLEAPPFPTLGPEKTQALPENISTAEEKISGYLTTIDPDAGRSFPQFVNIRHVVAADGTETDLNDTPGMLDTIAAGGYWAQHYADYDGDGWVAVRCPELDAEIPARVAAYSTICPPNFVPYTNQRALTEWTERDAPEAFRDGIWAIPPRPLSDRRLAANITLPAGFSIDDDTGTAIVSLPTDGAREQSGAPAVLVRRHLQLPDGAAGLFDPGWEISLDRTDNNMFFLEAYGLGTPFIEDAKVCAALSSYWPGPAPDSARKFQPDKQLGSAFKAWPTIAPLTDEEIGSVAAEGYGALLPWDGVPGPRLTVVDGEEVVDYADIYFTDYLTTFDRFTAALTGRIELEEYTARVLAMAHVYWALGIRLSDYRPQYELADVLDRFQAAKGEWTTLSFRPVADEDGEELTAAETALGVSLGGDVRYRFHLYRWNEVETKPADVRRVLVGIKDQAIAYADLTQVLLRRNEAWEHHVPPR